MNEFVFFFKCDFSQEQCSSLKMILGTKHVGAILNVLIWKKNCYVCALVGVLIKWLYEMHLCNDKDKISVFGWILMSCFWSCLALSYPKEMCANLGFYKNLHSTPEL